MFGEQKAELGLVKLHFWDPIKKKVTVATQVSECKERESAISLFLEHAAKT